MKLINHRNNCHSLQINKDNEIIFSYETPVIVIKDGNIYITTEKFSKTTQRHINHFNYDGIQLTQEQIENIAKELIHV